MHGHVPSQDSVGSNGKSLQKISGSELQETSLANDNVMAAIHAHENQDFADLNATCGPTFTGYFIDSFNEWEKGVPEGVETPEQCCQECINLNGK